MYRCCCYFVLIVFSLIFCGCIRELDTDLEGGKSKLVVSGELDMRGQEQGIYFSKSFHDIFEVPELQTTLDVELYEEGNPTPYVLTRAPADPGRYLIPASLEFVPSQSYFLKAAPADSDLGPVQSETFVPVKRSAATELLEYNELGHSLTLGLQLEVNESAARYLHLQLYSMTASGAFMQFFISGGNFNPGINVLNHRSGMLIDYEQIPEDKYLTFDVNYMPSEDFNSLVGQFLYISLRSVDEDYYLYNRSLSQQAELSNIPFSLPTSTFTNILNGYGLFSVYQSEIDSLLIQ